MKSKIKIDIVSDVVCPWCYIGKARLEKALEQTDADVQISWRPFQLHPQLPEGGIEKEAFMEMKFGSNGKEAFAQLSAVAKSEGLEIHKDDIKNIPNTLKAHRLIHLARLKGLDNEMAQALFIAYFAKGKDIESDEELIEIAVKAGLDKEEVVSFLKSGEGKVEVQEEESLFRNSGIKAVPSFIINEKYLIQGAQSAKVFLEAFKQLNTDTKEGMHCEDDSCVR